MSRRRTRFPDCELQGLHAPALYVVPEFFDPQRLKGMLRSGKEPAEREYVGGGADV